MRYLTVHGFFKVTSPLSIRHPVETFRPRNNNFPCDYFAGSVCFDEPVYPDPVDPPRPLPSHLPHPQRRPLFQGGCNSYRVLRKHRPWIYKF